MTLIAMIANLYLECVLISFSVNSLPLPWWKGVQCQQVEAWEPQRMVPYRELSFGFCCWQVGHSSLTTVRIPTFSGGLCYLPMKSCA